MRNKFLLLLFVFAVPLIVSCSSVGKSPDSIIPIKHTFKNGILTSYIEKLNPEDSYSIQLNAKMKGMEEHKVSYSYNDKDYTDDGNSYTAEIKIPMEGEWILDYVISNSDTTWTYSTIENLGVGNEEYYIDSNISPEIISVNDTVEFRFVIYNQFGETITQEEININLVSDNSSHVLSEKVKSKDGVFTFNFRFTENGIWRLDFISNLVSDSFLIPVGEESRNAINNMINNYENHSQENHIHEDSSQDNHINEIHVNH